MVETNRIDLEQIIQEKNFVQEELRFAHSKLNQVKLENDMITKKKNEAFDALKIESEAVKDLERKRDKAKYQIKQLIAKRIEKDRASKKSEGKEL